MEPLSAAVTVSLAAGAITADALVSPRIRNRGWRERIVNTSCGIARYAVHSLVHGAFLGLYAAILAVSPLQGSASSPSTWLFAFLAFDLLIFATHWLSHRVPVLWAIHSVHHQPVEIDVTVGLRTHVLTSLFYLPLLLPLAALGVPLEVFVPLGAVRLAAMALTHTRLRTPRWLDPFLNTPELHAVHHSADVRHHGTNIGGVLMLWDHLFGTYLPREPVARCGLPGPEARSALEANWLAFAASSFRAEVGATLSGRERIGQIAEIHGAQRLERGGLEVRHRFRDRAQGLGPDAKAPTGRIVIDREAWPLLVTPFPKRCPLTGLVLDDVGDHDSGAGRLGECGAARGEHGDETAGGCEG